MKRKIIMRALTGALIITFAASCAGTPKPAPQAPSEQPAVTPAPAAPAPQAEQKPPEPPKDLSKMEPDQATTDALASAQARAEKSRKQAFDVQSPTYFPDDWKAAENQYLAARDKAKDKNMAAYQEATKLYLSAADAYDAVAKKTLPLFADARQNELDQARALAVAVGAEKLVPDRLAVADAEVAKAHQQYQAGDYYGAADTAATARSRYLALKTGLDANAVKNTIDQRGFAGYDPSNYALASTKLDQAMGFYDQGNVPGARDASDEALLRFNLALNKGKEMNASSLGKAAVNEKNAATELKANVAVKDGYDNASNVLSQADAAYKAEKYDDAANLYTQAEQLFASVRATAADKRQKALDAMNRATKQMTESEQTAKNANAILEGGSR